MSSFSLPAYTARHEGALDTVGDVCRRFGTKVWVIGGHTALSVSRARIEASLATAGLTLLAVDWFGGLCSLENVAAQAARARALGAEMIVAVGGGKAIDTGKSTANELHLPVITIPTIAATCAAFSAVTARYKADGHFLDVQHLAFAPNAIIIDSGIIAASPARWLTAGMGDTLAKWYEIRAINAGREPDGGSMSAMMNGRLCYDLIERFGAQAMAAQAAGRAGAALDNVLDSIFIYAGMTSIMGVGVHSAAAHGVFEGFTVLDKTRELGHGFLVGYGNLVLLALEKRSDAELLEAIRLAKACGVAFQLDQLAPLTRSELQLVAESAAKTVDMHNMPFAITADNIVEAMLRVESLGKSEQ